MLGGRSILLLPFRHLADAKGLSRTSHIPGVSFSAGHTEGSGHRGALHLCSDFLGVGVTLGFTLQSLGVHNSRNLHLRLWGWGCA